MNEETVKKIRKRFMRVSFLAFFITMVLIAGLLYVTNYLLNVRIAKSTLEYIIANDGYLSGSMDREVGENSDQSQGNDYDGTENGEDYYSVNRFLDDIFNNGGDYSLDPEFTYSTRYFAILYNEQGAMTDIVINQIAAVSKAEAENYGNRFFNSRKNFGRFGNYYYQQGRLSNNGFIVVYLDCSSMMDNINRIMYLALFLIMFGVVVTAFVIRILSRRVVTEEIKNVRLQKRFITNASHELKTPLAVIRANTEMEEILNGESEWTQSTLRQVERMSGLIQNLVMISRSDESQVTEKAGECDVTAAVRETIKTFTPVATQDGKKMEEALQENIRILASGSQIRQLASLLIDNAIKYCDEGGTIRSELYEKGKNVHLIVSNDYKEGENVDYSRFFERFYREDQSHNTDKGGYGIGLSIAQSLVEQYHGSIHATWKKGVISFHCVLRTLKV